MNNSNPSPLLASSRRLKCACCGEYAGVFQQHNNQDTGWGMCVTCIRHVRGRGISEAEIADLYGTEGVNWGAPPPSIRVTIDYMQGYGQAFPTLELALTYAVEEVKKDSAVAAANTHEPHIDGVTAEDDEGHLWNLIDDNGFRWEQDEEPAT